MKKVFKWLLIMMSGALVLGIATVLITYAILAPDLPDVESLRDVRLQVPLRVFSEDGRLIGIFGEKRRIPVTIEEIPDALRHAFIAGEDARFYQHPGVDYQGISRAVWTLATTGEKSVGGSTITQQLARNFFLTMEKTFTRKIKEIFLALKIERHLGKDQILEHYVNKIFLGHRAYGVGAAAEVYYGRSVDELTIAQSAMIAALPKAPSRINPLNQPERALERRNYVLGRMLTLGYLDQAQYDSAKAEPDRAFYHGAIAEVSAPYVAEMARVAAIDLLGLKAYTGGYSVFTTIDSGLQIAAHKAVSVGLEEYDHRHGYRGAEAHIDLRETDTLVAWDEALSPFRPVSGLVPGLVIEVANKFALVYLADGQTIALDLSDMEWAAPFLTRDRTGAKPKSVSGIMKPGDVIRTRMHDDGRWKLGQVPEVEAALVSIDPNTGGIKALIGGYDFTRSKFNRVTQSRRQPGSSFKPFIYSAALARGFTTSTLVNDAPIVFKDSELERTWKPQNFSQKFYGPTRLREAMVNSRNLVSIRLLRTIGVPFGRDYVTRFGFAADELPNNLSMALGSASLTPLSMARGYAVFANSGFRVDTRFIHRITARGNEIVAKFPPPILCDDCTANDQALIAQIETDAPAQPRYRPLEVTSGEPADTNHGAGRTGSLAGGREKPVYAERVITPQNAYLVRSMMMDVIRRGTGVRAMQMGRKDLAGKTGTTNEQRDAWFSGYNSHMVTSVWVGFDNHEPLGRRELGGRAALPIWVDYMSEALQGLEDRPPKLPAGLAQARIDPETGLLARLENPDAITEIFQSGNLPDMEAQAVGGEDHGSIEEDPYEIY